MTLFVRAETPADVALVHAINTAAFGGEGEADLVDRLRNDGDLIISLVAEIDSVIVGHCAFSRLTIQTGGVVAQAVALAPVAVVPAEQKRGIGQKMIRDGIARLKAAGETLIVVLGEPEYYARFGFDADAATAYRTPYDGPYLQVLRLSDDVPAGGDVRYATAFAGL